MSPSYEYANLPMVESDIRLEQGKDGKTYNGIFLWNLIARIALEGLTVTPDLDTLSIKPSFDCYETY